MPVEIWMPPPHPHSAHLPQTQIFETKSLPQLLETEGTVSQKGVLNSFNVDDTLKLWVDQFSKRFCSTKDKTVHVNLPFGWMTLGWWSFGAPGVFTGGVVFGEFKEGDYNKKKQSLKFVLRSKYPKILSLSEFQ